MFDKLVDFLLSVLYDLLPVYFVKQYQRAVQYRAGVFLRVTDPGLRWKIPFYDQHENTTVVTTTLSIPTQSLTTNDGKSVVVKAAVKYNICDLEKFTLEVYDGFDAISDTAQGIIKQVITSKTWEECADNEIDNKITIKLRAEIKKWGIEIEKVTLTDLGLIRSIRLFNQNETTV